jgi:hypothetical protein
MYRRLLPAKIDAAKVALGIRDRFTLEEPIGGHNGRNEIIAFFSRKWANESDYRLIKELWALAQTGASGALRLETREYR